MAITTTTAHYIEPGAIVHVRDFPYRDDPRKSKDRYALVIGVDRQSRRAHLRGIFTNPFWGSAPIPSTYETGLHHDSYVGARIETIPFGRIDDYSGNAPYDYDPYNDGF